MGGGNWSSTAYADLSRSYKAKSIDDVFINTKTKTMSVDMDPKNISIRESRDSVDHPKSLAVAIFLDVTGSMGQIPKSIASESMPMLMETLIKNDIKDAHVLFGAIGDHVCDDFPLQVGQYEAATELLDKWLTSINIERGGGGQGMESYLLAWLIAGRHSSIDCFEKRGQKGFLFTIGDEESWSRIGALDYEEIMGYSPETALSDKQLLKEAQRMYHVFHIHAQQGDYRDNLHVLNYWKDLLGERLIIMEDYTKICEIISSIVSTMSGANIDDVVSSFDSSTALMVKNTIAPIMKNMVNVDKKSIITL